MSISDDATPPLPPPAPPPGDPARYAFGFILSLRELPAIAIIASVVAVVAALFAWTGGLFSSARLTQARVIDQFERTNGLHRGFRRNHPKGICFTGRFDSNGAGMRLSKASVFRPGGMPVFGRLAMAGGTPGMPDTPASVHSMAVSFALPDGEVWRMAINGIPVFGVATVRDLVDQLVAATPDPRTGKPDPAKLKAYMASHPKSARAAALVKAHPLPSDFFNTTYNSLNTFLFDDAAGRTVPVRWAMVPEDPFVAAHPETAAATDRNYQFDALIARVAKGPVRWHLVITLGQPGDPTDDATLPWPDQRERVDVGILTLDALSDEAHGPCRDVTFDPTLLPAGIRLSDDPILSARSGSYAVSFTRRAGEHPGVPAVRLSSSTGSATR